MCMTLSSLVTAGGGAGGSTVATGADSGRAICTGGAGGFGATGARIFEIGGSTDLCFGSELASSERFDLLSSMSEIVSGFGGGAVGACPTTGATAGGGGGAGAG